MSKLIGLSAQLRDLKPGESFYTKENRHKITALASKYGIKIKTEVKIVVNPKSLESEKILEVIVK